MNFWACMYGLVGVCLFIPLLPNMYMLICLPGLMPRPYVQFSIFISLNSFSMECPPIHPFASIEDEFGKIYRTQPGGITNFPFILQDQDKRIDLWPGRDNNGGEPTYVHIANSNTTHDCDLRQKQKTGIKRKEAEQGEKKKEKEKEKRKDGSKPPTDRERKRCSSVEDRIC